MNTAAPQISLEQARANLTEAMNGTVGVKNPKPPVLDGARQAALDAAALMRGQDGALDSASFEQLGQDLPADLRAWLLELPSFLSKKEREEQGDELSLARRLLVHGSLVGRPLQFSFLIKGDMPAVLRLQVTAQYLVQLTAECLGFYDHAVLRVPDHRPGIQVQ